jgi:hypothetical protein
MKNSRIRSLYVATHKIVTRALSLFARECLSFFTPFIYLCSGILSYEAIISLHKQWKQKRPNSLLFLANIFVFTSSLFFEIAILAGLAVIATPYVALQCITLCMEFILGHTSYMTNWKKIWDKKQSPEYRYRQAFKLAVRTIKRLLFFTTGMLILFAPVIAPLLLPLFFGWSIFWLIYKVGMGNYKPKNNPQPPCIDLKEGGQSTHSRNKRISLQDNLLKNASEFTSELNNSRN